MLTYDEVTSELIKALGSVRKILPESDWSAGRFASEFIRLFGNFNLADSLYVPDEALVNRLQDFERWCETRDGEDPGHLMEEIAFLAMRCLKGREAINSYQSYAAQHDLLISGSTAAWFLIMEHLHLPTDGRTIVVEAKNLDQRVTDAQFSRLCGVIQNKLQATCHLGIFFSREGASGFPKPPNREDEETRQRVLRDARATQVLFHARTCKFVIVLDRNDLRLLSQSGGLLRVLEAKIRDAEQGSGVSLQFDEQWDEVDLPGHLSQYV